MHDITLRIKNEIGLFQVYDLAPLKPSVLSRLNKFAGGNGANI